MADRSRNFDQIMENTTPFELNKSIHKWRENLGRSAVLRQEDLDELETHVRDVVAKLTGSELSVEEAFLIATRRLGKAEALEQEFAKTNTREVWLGRIMWMMAGVISLGIIGGIAHVASELSILGGYALISHNSYVLGPISLLSNLLSIGIGLFLVWWMISKKEQVCRQCIQRCLKYPVLSVCMIASFTIVTTIASSFLPVWKFKNMAPGDAVNVAMVSLWTYGLLLLLSIVYPSVFVCLLKRTKDRRNLVASVR